jgi:hypothetical protein
MSFFKDINDSESGAILSFAANSSQLGSLAWQIVAGIISLLSQSDTDKILNAIDQLESQLHADFFQLGLLIKRQTKIVTGEVDRVAIATALAHSDTGLLSLNTFLKVKNDNDLRSAIVETENGIQFFRNLGPPPNIIFMPGLAKAGTAWTSVIVVRDPKFRTSRPDYGALLQIIITLLGTMITLIKQQVDALSNRLMQHIS